MGRFCKTPLSSFLLTIGSKTYLANMFVEDSRLLA